MDKITDIDFAERVEQIKHFAHAVNAIGEQIVLLLMLDTGCSLKEIELSTIGEGGFNPIRVAEANGVSYKIHIDKAKFDFRVTKETKSLLLEN